MTQTKTKSPTLTPLMQEYVKDTDTPQIVKKALEIAANHPYYKPESMGSKDRFATFLTKEEATYRGELRGILVPENSWKAVYRFGRAIEEARKQIKKSTN